MNIKETKAFVVRQERLAAKLELERVKLELKLIEINARAEAKIKIAEAETKARAERIEKKKEFSDYSKANSLERISAMKNPVKSRQEYNREQEVKKNLNDPINKMIDELLKIAAED